MPDVHISKSSHSGIPTERYISTDCFAKPVQIPVSDLIRLQFTSGSLTVLSDSPNTILPLWDVGGCHPHSDLDADLTVFVSVQRVALCLKQLMSKGCLDAAALANFAPCTGDGCRLAALEPDCKVSKWERGEIENSMFASFFGHWSNFFWPGAQTRAKCTILVRMPVSPPWHVDRVKRFEFSKSVSLNLLGWDYCSIHCHWAGSLCKGCLPEIGTGELWPHLTNVHREGHS